eukprot:COSAG02_NODE_54578_length_295_cov_0.795918_1_plen_50_part_01
MAIASILGRSRRSASAVKAARLALIWVAVDSIRKMWATRLLVTVSILSKH